MTFQIFMILVAGGTTLFLLLLEWRRQNRSHLPARLLATVVAVATMLLMAFTNDEKEAARHPMSVVVATDGADPDSVSQFAQRYTQQQIFSYGNTVAAARQKDIWIPVMEWKCFANSHKNDTLHVFGYGLPDEVLKILSPNLIMFHHAPAYSFISQIYWKPELQTGEPLIIQGHCENRLHKKMVVTLQAFGLVRDSVIIDGDSSADFTLETIPLHHGPATYSLMAFSGRDTLFREPIPVKVLTAAPLQLLLLSASPNFEQTFLKNHLSQQGYRFNSLSTVSTRKINRQYINTAKSASDNLTTELIRETDIVITDEETLQTLPQAERAAIKNAVATDGLGLVLNLGSQPAASEFYNYLFPVSAMAQAKTSHTIELHSTNGDSSRFRFTLAEASEINSRPDTRPLLQDGGLHTYAAITRYGNGYIVATTLPATYPLALSGNSTAYRQLWSVLLNPAARRRDDSVTWHWQTDFPRVNDRAQLFTEQNANNSLQLKVSGDRLFMAQDPLLSYQWHAQYWPSRHGWVQTKPGDLADLRYIYTSVDWQQLNYLTNEQATDRYVQQQSKLQAAHRTLNKAAPAFDARWLWLLLFLAACILLWVEQKSG